MRKRIGQIQGIPVVTSTGGSFKSNEILYEGPENIRAAKEGDVKLTLINNGVVTVASGGTSGGGSVGSYKPRYFFPEPGCFSNLEGNENAEEIKGLAKMVFDKVCYVQYESIQYLSYASLIDILGNYQDKLPFSIFPQLGYQIDWNTNTYKDASTSVDEIITALIELGVIADPSKLTEITEEEFYSFGRN